MYIYICTYIFTHCYNTYIHIYLLPGNLSIHIYLFLHLHGHGWSPGEADSDEGQRFRRAWRAAGHHGSIGRLLAQTL